MSMQTCSTDSTISKIVGAAILAFLLGCDSRVSIDDYPPNSQTASKFRNLLEESGDGVAESENDSPTANPTGYATLRGRVVIQGTPPANPEINVSRDNDMCGASARDLQLIVSADGGIQNVLIYADEIPEAWCHESAGQTNEDFIFDQKNCVFLTRVSAFQISQKMKILNSDPKGHNTDFSPRFGASFNQLIAAGGYGYYQTDTEEKQPVSVKCAIHPWMQAWLFPRSNGYFSVTDSEGNFEIPNLPAGVEITLRAWHEIPKYIQNVAVSGEEQKWSRGRFRRTLEVDGVLDLSVAIDADEFE